MDENRIAEVIRANYDSETDILTFFLTEFPQDGLAEEAADEIWVRYRPDTNRVLTIDIHNFSHRLRTVFGPAITYSERSTPQRIDVLDGLNLIAVNQ